MLKKYQLICFLLILIPFVSVSLAENIDVSAQTKKAQMVWGKKIVGHIKTNCKKVSNTEATQDYQAKVKLLISERGYILGKVLITCEGSLTDCLSINNALIDSEPLPLPPKSSSKPDRTINIHLR